MDMFILLCTYAFKLFFGRQSQACCSLWIVSVLFPNFTNPNQKLREPHKPSWRWIVPSKHFCNGFHPVFFTDFNFNLIIQIRILPSISGLIQSCLFFPLLDLRLISILLFLISCSLVFLVTSSTNSIWNNLETCNHDSCGTCRVAVGAVAPIIVLCDSPYALTAGLWQRFLHTAWRSVFSCMHF